MIVEFDSIKTRRIMKTKKHKLTILQGTIGDFAVDQIGWLSEEKQKEFWRNHNDYVEELKSQGQYLKPIEIELELQEDSLYDNNQNTIGNPIESYRMTFLNFTQ